MNTAIITRKKERNRYLVRRICPLLVIVFILVCMPGCVRRGALSRSLQSESEKPSQNMNNTKKVRYVSASKLEEDKWAVENYFIEKGDILEISVWQIEELQREVVVRPDGKISFPLIGDVLAEGKSIEELREEIVEKIKLFIKIPQVSVNILEFGGKRAVILGEVSSEGIIRFNTPTRLLEAVALAGGFTTDANADRVFIIRDAFEDEPTIILANANSIVRQAELKENILIRSGDIIYVHKAFIADVKRFMDSIFGKVVGYAETYYGDTWKRRKAGTWVHKSDF